MLLIIAWLWGGVGGSGEKARGPWQHNVCAAEPPRTGPRAGAQDGVRYSQLCYGHTGLHAALGNESCLCLELGDRDKTAISGQLSIINVTQVPVNPSSSLSGALCQEQLCHSSWLLCNSRCSRGEVRRLFQKTLISADKPMFCILLSHFT